MIRMLPALRGVDRALEPDVREVGHRQRVDDAPRLVHRVAFQLAADRGADAAARAVAADDVLGPDRRGLPVSSRPFRCAAVTVTGYSAAPSWSIRMSVACRP
jgi:hypothetical protein